MSFNSSNSSPRQRKLSDLRVIDLQRELRSFGVVFDKKELKVSLLEKLRQALIHKNLDPDLYLFDESKTNLADETAQNREESSFQDTNLLNSSSSEIQSETLMDVENPVQTMAKSPTTDCTNASPSRLVIDDESGDPVHQLETNNIARQCTERTETDATFLDKNQLSHHKEDENNNEKIDQNVDQQAYAITDRDLQNKMSDETKADIDQQNSSNELTSNTDNDQATVLDTDWTVFQPHATSIEEKTNDDMNLSKSTDENQNGSSQNEQNAKATNSKSHKDQCHLWVSNIAKETHASHLKELFSKHGKVLTTKVIGSTSAQWFGYITLASSEDVEKCINALHQTELHGKKIYVDWEMHDSKSHSNTKTSQSSISKGQEAKSDQHSLSKEKTRQRESDFEQRNKSLSRKRTASSSTEKKKKILNSDANMKNKDERARRSHEKETSSKRPRESSNTSHSNTTKTNSSRGDSSKSNDPSVNRFTHRPNSKDSRDDRLPQRSRSPRRNSNDASKIKMASSISKRSRSSEKRESSSSTSLSRYRSSSSEKFKTQLSSSNKYDRNKESSSKDHHRPGSSGSFDSNRRSRHEKDLHDRKHDAQLLEEEKIKEHQRRIDEERKLVKRQLEFLERERLEVERTRLALEKEKQDQAREVEKQKRLADEAKHRQQQIEAKLRDEKLQRLAHGDIKRSRAAPHHETQRRHQPNTHENSKHGNNSNREFDYRSSINSIDDRDRHRPVKDLDRVYFPDNKKSFTSSNDHPRDTIFRDRLPYRDSNLVISTPGLNNDSSLPIGSSIHNQRYSASSSNQHRLPDPYVNLPPRGRDMAIPSGPSVVPTFERSTRTINSSSNTSDVLTRRPYGRDTFDSRDYHHDTERHDRSSPTSNKLGREPIDTNHWDRPKPRDSTHYASDAHKYMNNQYISESSSQSVQQAGLWSSAPPSRQASHHSDPPAKLDSYTWQQPPQPTTSQTTASHHSQNMASTHDRSRSNLANHQRLQMIQSNQTTSSATPSTSSGSRSNMTNQPHLYNHPGIGVSALPGSHQQHVPLVPPTTSLHHTATYLTQTVPPTGLVLHSSGQTRTYEPHYVVTQALPPQRRY